MTALISILVLVFIFVAIWQMVKIFDLTQTGKSIENNQVANDNDNKVNGYLMIGFLIFIYAITIVCIAKYGDLVDPDTINDLINKEMILQNLVE